MPKFIIEREIPGAGKLSPQELHAVSHKSCGVLQDMQQKSGGPQIQWLESCVTADKLYCIYIAPDEDSVREHARLGGFPANVVNRIGTIIDPTTGD